jgi:hypothetical protein
MRSEYRELLKQIRQLAREILPKRNPTARYSREETLRILAFRLFAHAEIEAFLELCAETLRLAYATNNGAGALSRSATYRLIWSSQASLKYPPTSLTKLPKDVGKTINGILKNHENTIDNNHGVSEKDVLKLLVPLGFELSFFDHDWLISMTDLTVARGNAAHNSAMNVGADQPTPDGERQRLVKPLWGLGQVSAEVDRLCSLS